MQVYLPDGLYRAVKGRLPACLGVAAGGSPSRTAPATPFFEETDRYLEELVEEVGEPFDRGRRSAEALARRVKHQKKAG